MQQNKIYLIGQGQISFNICATPILILQPPNQENISVLPSSFILSISCNSCFILVINYIALLTIITSPIYIKAATKEEPNFLINRKLSKRANMKFQESGADESFAYHCLLAYLSPYKLFFKWRIFTSGITYLSRGFIYTFLCKLPWKKDCSRLTDD